MKMNVPFIKDPRVLDQMLPYLTHLYGNPHSRTHAFGWEGEKAVEDAREVNKMNNFWNRIIEFHT